MVGEITGVEIPHGVTASLDGRYLYLSNEHLSALDVVDATTLKVSTRIPLSGRPNNVALSKDGKKVYIGIRQAPGALDVIDTATLKNVKSVPVKGEIHNVYVTPDGRFAVAGSIAQKTISIVDTARPCAGAPCSPSVWGCSPSIGGCGTRATSLPVAKSTATNPWKSDNCT